MAEKKKITIGKIIYLLSAAIIVVMLVNPTAKSLLIRGLIGIGFFKPQIPVQVSKRPLADPVNIAFIDSSGNVLNTNSLKGKVIFVNLWATWCPPCIAEMPNLNAFYKRYKNYPNAVFILADVDNNYTKAKAFMKKHQYILPVYTLAGNIPENIMDGTIPTTLIFNKKGELVFKHTNAANFRELADAERIGMLVQKTAIEESKKAHNANKPMPQYQIHAFYLVHEKLF